MRLLRSAALAAACSVLAGCPGATTPPTPLAASTRVAPKASPAIAASKTTAISGSALAPSTMVAAGGGNVLSHNGSVMVAAGGGNLVAAGGGNLVAAGGGNYKLLATEQKPLAGAFVYLTDGQGHLIADAPTTTTDANGKYKLEKVPAEGSFVVNVRAKNAAGTETDLITLVEPAKGTTADVSTETTCVLVSLLGESGKPLDGLGLSTFNAAVLILRPELAGRNVPDLADRKAILGWMDKLMAEIAQLKAQMTDLKGQLTALKGQLEGLGDQLNGKLDAITGQLGGLLKTPEPTPTIAPDPVAAQTATPVPAFQAKPQWALRAAIAAAAGDTKDRRFLIHSRVVGEQDLDDDGTPGAGIQVQLPGQPADGQVYDVFAAEDKDGLDVALMANAANMIGTITVSGGKATFEGPGPLKLVPVLAPYYQVKVDFKDDRKLTWRGKGAAPAGPVKLTFACEKENENWSHENPDFSVTVQGGANNLANLSWAAVELPARYKVTAAWGDQVQVAGQLRVYTRHYKDEVDVSFDLPSKDQTWDLDGL